MALIVSAASGNFNAGATWVGGVVPTVGDEARASTGHTVTITESVTCDQVSNAGTGTFVLTNGVTLTANITHNNTNTNVVSISGTNSAAIVGNITSPSVGLSNASTASITHSSTGTLTITGNIIGCKQNNAFCQAINVTTSGILNVVGSITAGSGGNSTTLLCHGINAVSGTINITGNVYGNSLPSNTGVVCNNNNAINMTASGTIVIVGLMQAGIYNSAAVNSINTAASLSIIGDFNAVNSWPAINAAASANNSFSGNFIASSNGTMPINCVRYRVFPVPVAAKTRYALNGTSTFVDMFTADNTGLAPAVGDVRAGVVYGSATGVLAVPAANSVAFGVPVDATTGTAVLSLASVIQDLWAAPTSGMTTAGSIGERLKNSATVATTGEQLSIALTAP